MEENTPVVDEEIDPGFTAPSFSTEGMPEWLVGLINRLMQVFTKLLIKFGIKLAF